MTPFGSARAPGAGVLQGPLRRRALGAVVLGGPLRGWGGELPAAAEAGAASAVGPWVGLLLAATAVLLVTLLIAVWAALRQARLRRSVQQQLADAIARADADAARRAAEPAPVAPTPPAAELPVLPPHESFIYTVAHDLRAPIRVVEGFTKIIKEDFGAQIDAVGNAHLDRVLAAALRMNEMIDGLLAISRLSTQPLMRRPVDLSAVATEVLGDLRRDAPDRDVQSRVEPGLLTTGDPALLRVLIENLVGNAWKYTGKTANARIEIERHPTAADTFTVRDNGAGFDMRYAGRLFGVFQRLHNVSDFPGTGIGLASVQRIVHRHGGTVRCEAELRRGASFHFSLPQAGLARPDLSPVGAAPPPPGEPG